MTSADQPVSALPLDPIDGEVALNVAAFARIATPLLLESLLQFIAVSTGHDPVSLAFQASIHPLNYETKTR